MNHEEALSYLANHYAVEPGQSDRPRKPTLDRMRDLVEAMGDPHCGIPTIHVTGTNGKGSTSRLAIDLLVGHNLHVGGYTSPHLESVNERITVNGDPVDDQSFADAINLVATVEPLLEAKWGQSLTYFELTTAAALGWHAETATDVRVVEVGLGGTWDATNVVDAEVAVVTNVALDHVETLGPARTDIARDKSGIIGPESVVVLGEPDPELRDIFLSRPSAGMFVVGSDFELTQNQLAVGGRAVSVRTKFGTYEDLFLRLNGSHQGDNAALALVAVEAFFGHAIDTDIVANAFANASLPARFEIVARRPLVVIDGAHNPAGAAAVMDTLYDDFTTREAPVLVVGFNTPRDPLEMLRAFSADRAAAVVCTAADWARALPAAEIAQVASTMCANTLAVPSVSDAVDTAIELAGEAGTVFIGGSLYVAGEARRHLVPEPRPIVPESPPSEAATDAIGIGDEDPLLSP